MIGTYEFKANKENIMKLLFILNPVAGKGKSMRFLPIIKEVCSKEQIEYTIKMTHHAGGATPLVKWGIEHGYDRIIAVGGDGTVNETVNGIIGSKAVLGVVPGGTGNDFIRSISSTKNTDQYILDVIHGEVKSIDLGLCNGQYFINMASTGLDTQVVMHTEKVKKYFSGSAAYLIAAPFSILSYKGWDMKIQIDEETVQDKTLLVAIANGRYYGGGVMPTPDAKLDDGFFDLCHVKHLSRPRIFQLLPKYIKGKHMNLKEVYLTKGKEITITCDSDFPLNLDGEITMTSKASFKIINNAISIVRPK